MMRKMQLKMSWVLICKIQPFKSFFVRSKMFYTLKCFLYKIKQLKKYLPIYCKLNSVYIKKSIQFTKLVIMLEFSDFFLMRRCVAANFGKDILQTIFKSLIKEFLLLAGANQTRLEKIGNKKASFYLN